MTKLYRGIDRRYAAAVGLGLGFGVEPAQAHLVTTGLGPIYDGAAHFATTPEDLLTVAGLAVLAGLRGAAHGRWALFVLSAFWLVGGAAGLLIARPTSDFATAISLLLIGGLVAADPPLSLWATAAIVAILATARGYADGSTLPSGGNGFLTVLGMIAVVFVTFALVTGSLLQLRSRLARIAMRVSGSWIAASGLLLLGWSLRGELTG
jgi:urease accessory protein